MVYDIEFIRRVDGQAERVAVHAIKLVADSISAVITQADDLLKTLATVPRPNGYRILNADGTIAHEFVEPGDP